MAHINNGILLSHEKESLSLAPWEDMGGIQFNKISKQKKDKINMFSFLLTYEVKQVINKRQYWSVQARKGKKTKTGKKEENLEKDQISQRQEIGTRCGASWSNKEPAA